jgi:hypothetical protein
MRITRDAWLGISILLALILVISAAVLQQNNEPGIDYLSSSAAPSGALALKLWLAELGHPALESAAAVFEPAPGTDTIIMLQPLLPLSEAEWRRLDEWIDQGGLFILAGDNYATAEILGRFEFSLAFLDPAAEELVAASPLLKSPALPSSIPLVTDLALSTGRSDFIPLFIAKGQPVAVFFKHGRGQVMLSSNPYPFSNKALKEQALAGVVLNLVALGARGAVWFDDWHHGIQGAAVIGPGQWLRFTPGGHAILFTTAAVFLALLLRGAPFGRPIPLRHELKRRGPLEHVTAIANLKRRAGHRAEVLGQYHQNLKRHLGRRYRLDPSLPDAEFARLLGNYNPSIDTTALLGLLERLSQKHPAEADLVRTAAEAARWMKG